MAEPKYPKGFEDFYYKVKIFAPKILNGTLVSIDPSSGGSSVPGFAVFYKGELQTAGTINLGKKASIYERLQVLGEKIKLLTPETPDVFAIELIRGRMAHVHLQWAIGASISAAKTPVVIECPILVWKALAKITEGYTKGDEDDAVKIGEVIIKLARRDYVG